MPRGLRTGWSFALPVGVVIGIVTALTPAAESDITGAIATIKAVDREGKSNNDVAVAWKALVKEGGPALLPTLAAIDDVNPTASNWLRTAIDAIADAEKTAGHSLPADKLEAFIAETKNAPTARHLAFELLINQDKAARERLLPTFLNDPSNDLRYEAIADQLEKLEKSARPSVKDELLKLLSYARDEKQVDRIVKKLEGYQVKVSLTEHFAFLTHWHVVGPFDCTQGKALTTKYAPEDRVSVIEKLKGKGGSDVGWKLFTTRDKNGVVDLNKVIAKEHDAVAYAAATVVSERATPAEIRVATPNAVQIFLNGKKLFEREEYHHGAPMDHNVGKGTLAAGPNLIVVKVCQNNQKEIWAQNWQFQLRVCDATGGPITGVTQLIPDGDNKVKTVKLGVVPASTENKEEKK